jgi:CoA:oxalate CoA-transferase
MILADLGADVVKVERPEIGDDTRQFGPFLPSGLSAYFASINRGKRSMTLDLKQESDRTVFRQLATQADVLVENFRAGTMESFGLSAESLQANNPKLIYAALSGFGHSGSDTNRPAYDIIIQAMSGLMSITGEDQDNCVRVGTSISDILTGMFGAISILAALRKRESDGEGTVIDLAMLDCTVAALENAVSRYAVSGESPTPLGTRHPSITPFQAFQTSDAPIVVAAGNDSLWRKLCQVLDASELIDEPRLVTNEDRTRNRSFLEEQLGSRFRSRSQSEWLAALDEAGVPAAAIRNIEQVVHDEHLQSRDMLHEMDDGADGTFLTAGSPLRMNDAPPPLGKHAPELGEHADSILKEWLDRP